MVNKELSDCAERLLAVSLSDRDQPEKVERLIAEALTIRDELQEQTRALTIRIDRAVNIHEDIQRSLFYDV